MGISAFFLPCSIDDHGCIEEGDGSGGTIHRHSVKRGQSSVSHMHATLCFIFSYLDLSSSQKRANKNNNKKKKKKSCTTHRREPTVPWTGLVDPCALVEGFLRPNSWSSFLRMASSFRVCRLRASSEAERPSGVPGALVWLEGEGTVVRFIVGAPTADPAVDFWYPEFLSMTVLSFVSVLLLGGGVV